MSIYDTLAEEFGISRSRAKLLAYRVAFGIATNGLPEGFKERALTLITDMSIRSHEPGKTR